MYRARIRPTYALHGNIGAKFTFRYNRPESSSRFNQYASQIILEGNCSNSIYVFGMFTINGLILALFFML